MLVHATITITTISNTRMYICIPFALSQPTNPHTPFTINSTQPNPPPSELQAEAEQKLKHKISEVEELHKGFIEKERILANGAVIQV